MEGRADPVSRAACAELPLVAAVLCMEAAPCRVLRAARHARACRLDDRRVLPRAQIGGTSADPLPRLALLCGVSEPCIISDQRLRKGLFQTIPRFGTALFFMMQETLRRASFRSLEKNARPLASNAAFLLFGIRAVSTKGSSLLLPKSKSTAVFETTVLCMLCRSIGAEGAFRFDQLVFAFSTFDHSP